MAINLGDVGIKTNDRCRNWSSKIRVLNIPGICGMLVNSLNAPFFFGAKKGTRFGEKEHKMPQEQKSFEDLVKEAPAAPAAGTVSLVGTLAQSSEAGKFVLTLQDGSPVTLETAAVKAHTVLGTSVGQTIVRVDVEAGKIPAINPQPLPPQANALGTPFTNPDVDFATIAAADRPITIPDIDHPFTLPLYDYTYELSGKLGDGVKKAA
jgi:hypothetical protein